MQEALKEQVLCREQTESSRVVEGCVENAEEDQS